MRRIALWLFLLLLLLGGLYWIAINNLEPIQINYRDWQLLVQPEAAGLVLFVTLMLSYLLLRTVAILFHIPSLIGHQQRRQRQQKIALLREDIVTQFLEQKPRKALKTALKYQQMAPQDWFSCLLVAILWQQEKDIGNALQYLEKAKKEAPNRALALDLLALRWRLKSDMPEALSAVAGFCQQHPQEAKHQPLLAKHYYRSESWTALLDMIPMLRNEVDEEQLDKWLTDAHIAQLRAAQQESERLDLIWEALPPEQRRDSRLIRVYSESLLQQRRYPEAGRLLRQAIQKKWDQELLELYSQFTEQGAAEEHLRVIEGWLEQQPKNALLFLLAGKLSMRCKLWRKSQSYLEQSQQLKPCPEGYQLLALLAEKMEESEEQIIALYRQGMALASGHSNEAIEQAPLKLLSQSHN